jgi:HK97 family phage portal protein
MAVRSAYRPLVFTEAEPGTSAARARVSAEAGYAFMGLDDPALLEFLGGGGTASGATVNTHTALRNTAMFRAVSLISNSVGMLPLQLIEEETKKKAVDHPLYRLLHREPNNWQSAFDFRCLMQLRALVKGNAYALVIRSMGRVIRLVPIDPDRVRPVQGPDWTVRYEYQRPDGGKVVYAAEEIFHLRGLSLDGLNGLSLVTQAREAIGEALQAQRASARLFKHGVLAGAPLQTDNRLSDEAFERLKASLEEIYTGADNAHKSPIFEEGVKFGTGPSTARDSQLLELRRFGVEETARVSGVPRPLLAMDETAWGSGIGELGRFFVTYALDPWFTAWEQAVERTLLVGKEKDQYAAKFNAGALMRGSLKDQADFFAKALGAGGHSPFAEQNEIRDLLDWAPHPDGYGLKQPMAARTSPASEKDDPDDEAEDGSRPRRRAAKPGDRDEG